MVQIGRRARHASDTGALIESGSLLLFFSSEMQASRPQRNRRFGNVPAVAGSGLMTLQISGFLFLSCSHGREGWCGKL